MHPPLRTSSDPALLASPDLFDAVPTSLWLEDYSALKRLLDQWRHDGVTDLRAFLAQDPLRVHQCASCIRLLRVNRATLTLFGASSLQELSGRLADVLRDDTMQTYVDELVQLWNGSLAFTGKTVNYSLDGRRIDVLLRGTVLAGHEHTWEQVLVVVDDITELESARHKLIESEQYAHGIFQQAPVSLWVEDFSAIRRLLADLRRQGIEDFRTFTDVHPDFVERCMSEIRVLDVNRYTLFMFNAPTKADLLARLPEVFRDDMRQHFREQLIDLWDGKLFQTREVVNYSLDGNALHVHMQFSVLPGHDNDWSMVLLALTDITARKKAEAYLEYLGKHDVLTKLKNRSFYLDEINRIERKGPFPLTVIAIDLNNLKDVNDSQGHAAGDALLRRAGEVLAKAVEAPCQAARIGGDEFMVLLPGYDVDAGLSLMDDIQKLVALNNQFYTGAPLSLSMGCATCHDRAGMTEVLRSADLAMYQNKREYHASMAGQ
jgi:diguanylate cyclase (GGDEF)-like protein